MHAPCTRHARAMHAPPCTRHAHAMHTQCTRHAHAMHTPLRRHTACRGAGRSWRRARPGVGLLAAIVRFEVWRVLARVGGEDLGQLEGVEAAWLGLGLGLG